MLEVYIVKRDLLTYFRVFAKARKDREDVQNVFEAVKKAAKKKGVWSDFEVAAHTFVKAIRFQREHETNDPAWDVARYANLYAQRKFWAIYKLMTDEEPTDEERAVFVEIFCDVERLLHLSADGKSLVFGKEESKEEER